MQEQLRKPTLNARYEREFLCFHHSASLIEVARRMYESGESTVLVTEGERATPVGIITASSVVTAMASRGPPGALCAGDVVSPITEFAHASNELVRALERMNKLGSRTMAILNDHGAVIGLLSCAD